MSDDETNRMYKETQASLLKIKEEGLGIDQSLCMNQLVLVKKDFASNDESVTAAALDMLDFLLSLNIEVVQIEVIKMLEDSTLNKVILSSVVRSFKKKFTNAINENNFNFTEILMPWKNENVTELVNILEEICMEDLVKDQCKHFFINKTIPAMMCLNISSEIRDMLINIAFMLSTIIPISDLNSKELTVFLNEVNTEYVKNIGELRDKGYPNWHNLWMFLVRFCDKNIHNSMELTNRLLRVVEYAFRNPSYQQRLKGYDCWKELIDNASLDMTHVCSPKQIKLLITPLKAKFSKQELVICKRFEVFVYLLEKLQQKAVLCLTEFLEFCFGPVGDNKNASKTGQGKSVPQLWTKSAKVLLEILGHSHGETISCLPTEDVVKLESPVVNHTNLINHYKSVINSVGECSILLKDVEMQTKKETVIKCMWKSILILVISNTRENKENYFKVISDVLDNYIERSKKDSYFEDLLMMIFTVLMSFEKEFAYELIQYILEQLLTIVFTSNTVFPNIAESFAQVITYCFTQYMNVEGKLKTVKDILSVFVKLKSNEQNGSAVGKIWMCLTDELISDLSVEKIEEFEEFGDFFLWPAYYMHRLDEVVKKQIKVHWMKLYKKISVESEQKKQNIMRELEKIFKNNPLLSPGVVSLLNVVSQAETKYSKEFVIKLMEVSSLILQFPNLHGDEEQKVACMVMQNFEPSLECYKDDDDDVVIRNVCTCIEHILCIHKNYKLLDNLANFIKNCREELRSKFTKMLHDLLLDLYNKENDIKSFGAKELQKVLTAFDARNTDDKNSPATSKLFVTPGGRSARIANLVKKTPKSPRSPKAKSKKDKLSKPSSTALQLFGKDLETFTPAKVKGSLLYNTPLLRSKKIVSSLCPKTENSPLFSDEKSEEFVPIDTEIKFQPEKLNEHQREILKKRREDIPALYQDLSQSMSQDIFSSRSSASKDVNEAISGTEKPVEGAKVIVEMIEQPHAGTNKHEELANDSFFADIAPPELQPATVEEDEVLLGFASIEQNVDEDKKGIRTADFSSESMQKNQTNSQNSQETVTVAAEQTVKEERKEIPLEDFLSASPEKHQSNSQYSQHTAAPFTDQEEKKETSQDLFSELIGKNQFSEQVAKDHPKIEDTTKANVTPDETQMHDINEFFKSSRRGKSKKKKVELELQKLRMNLVGTEDDLSYFSRRTRLKDKMDKLEEKVKLDKLEELDTPIKNPQQVIPASTPRRKKGSHSLEKTETESKIKRSKSVDAVKEIKKEKKTREKKRETKVNLEDATSTNSMAKTSPDKQSKRGRKASLKSEVSDVPEKMSPEDGGIKKRRKGRPPKAIKEGDQVEMPAEVKEVKRRKKKANLQAVISESDTSGMSPEGSKIVEEVSTPKKRRKKSVPCFEDEKIKTPDLDLPEKKKRGRKPKNIENKEKISGNKRGRKRKRRSTSLDESEDIIESSQESTNDVKSLFNLSRRRSVLEEKVSQFQDKTVIRQNVIRSIDIASKEKIGDNIESAVMEEVPADINTTQDTTLSQDTTQDSNHNQDTQTQDTDTQNVPTQDTQTQETPTQSDLITSSVDNRPSVPYFDLPKKPQLTDSERMMCEMDTMSICMDSNNVTLRSQRNRNLEIPATTCSIPLPNEETIKMDDILDTSSSKRISSIPSSPVTADTPNKTTELLNSTLDISPINSKSSSLDGEIPYDSSVTVSLDFKSKLEELGKIRNEQFLVGSQIPVGSTDDLKEDNAAVHNQDGMLYVEEAVGSEEIIPEQDVEVNSEIEKILGRADDVNSGKEITSVRERSSELFSVVNINSAVSHRILIKKRGGGLSMSPSTGRIKRLMSNFNQKRIEDFAGDVPEEDILTFSREVPSPLAVPRSSILKRKLSDSSEPDGGLPCAKRKRVNFSDPCLTSKKIFIKEDYQQDRPTLEVQCLFGTSDSQTKGDNFQELFELPDELDSSEKNAESDNIETEPPLDIINPLGLQRDKPIYPKLVSSKDDVLIILKKVTSPMFVSALLSKLHSKNIRTVGDLAKLSEVEVNRFPFKVPVVANVYKALDNYYKKTVGKEDSGKADETKVNGGAEEEDDNKIVPVDAETRCEELLDKLNVESISAEDLGNILFSLFDKQQVISLIKDHCNISAIDFLEEKDVIVMMKDVLEVVGIPKILDVLLESFNDLEDEAVFFNWILKYSMNKPFVKFVENRSLVDIQTGLKESINKKMFNRRQIIDNCLIPLIENPTDISNFINKISVVQLGDVVIKRLYSTDYDTDQFLNKMLQAHTSKSIFTCNKTSSTQDIVACFQRCIDTQEEPKQSEIMIEMFKFICSKLQMNTLVDLHIDFLKRIPYMLTGNREK